MKKIYEKIQIEVISFEEDIVTASKVDGDENIYEIPDGWGFN